MLLVVVAAHPTALDPVFGAMGGKTPHCYNCLLRYASVNGGIRQTKSVFVATDRISVSVHIGRRVSTLLQYLTT